MCPALWQAASFAGIAAFFVQNNYFMPYFLWNTDLRTGSKSLDAEHRKLTLLIDAFIAASERDASVHTVSLQLDNLLAFTREHFEHENSDMRRIAYADCAIHEAEHTRVLHELQVLKQRIESGQHTSELGIYDFLRTWLHEHILNFDKPMVEAQKSCGRNPQS